MRQGISVFLRVRNEEETLNLALTSAKNIGDQIVFVDNCSTDNSVKIAERFKEKHNLDNMEIRKFEYDPKIREATLSDLYNFTLNFTTGKWCVKWDGDLYSNEEDCKKFRDSMLKYDDHERVQGLYFSNKVVYFNKKLMQKGFGAELGAFKFSSETIYVDFHRQGTLIAGECLYKQNKLFIANDVLHDPIIWHIRTKSDEDFVRSRLIYLYYREKPEITFDEFVLQKKGKLTWEEMCRPYLGELETISEKALNDLTRIKWKID